MAIGNKMRNFNLGTVLFTIVFAAIVMFIVFAFYHAAMHPQKCAKWEDVQVTKCIDNSRGPANKYCYATYTRVESICVQYTYDK